MDDLHNKQQHDDEKLCASCDRCRSRKTKCDGKRPCGNCVAKYMKKYKVASVEGVPEAEFECVFSPAKRRGPVPGRTPSQPRSLNEMIGTNNTNSNTMNNNNMMSNGTNFDWGNSDAVMQQHQQQPISSFSGGMDGNNILNQFNLMRQMQLQLPLQQQEQLPLQQFQQQQMPLQQLHQQIPLQQHVPLQQHQLEPQIPLLQQQHMMDTSDTSSARRMRMELVPNAAVAVGGVPRTVSDHTHLLDRNDPDGSCLFSYFKVSIDELFRLPPTPTDEEYCLRLNIPGMTPRMIPGTHLAALSAARFAEIALGAMVHNEISLAMELCNAVVHCLRESVKEPVQTPIMLEVSKAYFLLGVFRACRGDLARYFKYRRVCMTYLGKLENSNRTATLTSAISYLDAWAYMIYNGDEKMVPNADQTLPPPAGCATNGMVNPIEVKYNTRTSIPAVVSDPKNKNWIQGAPPVYLNNEAPPHARSLDALACAVRSCCDQANGRFAQMMKTEGTQSDALIPQATIMTPTATAVMSHETELCSRNMVLAAYTLMQQQESTTKGRHHSEGHQMIISAMDAFLENNDDEGGTAFTDSQIQSLLSVCNTAVANPFLLHHAGPTYHMVTNATILLCHLLNAMHAMKQSGQVEEMEIAMFEEVLDTFIAIRKLLTIHRRKLPVKIRCHGIPRPNLMNTNASAPIVDLGETLLCACRGCQGFVLMACSPCVASERARDAAKRMEVELQHEAQAIEMGEMDTDLDNNGTDFDLDDDALLSMISSLIQN